MSLNKRLISTETPIVVSENFAILEYRGNGTSQTVSMSFAPDIVMAVKNSNFGSTTEMIYADRMFPTGNYFEFSDSTSSGSLADGKITGFTSNGFTIGSHEDVNTNSYYYTAYAWKVNSGVGNPSTNTQTGMSTVLYSGNGVYGRNINHNLGKTPVGVIVKKLSANRNLVGKAIGVSAHYGNYWGSTTGATDSNQYWKDTSPNSTRFTVGARTDVNESGAQYYAWCHTPIDGFSAYGTYTGNGSDTNGPTVTTGFKPGAVFVKLAEVGVASSGWVADNVTKQSSPGGTPTDAYYWTLSSSGTGYFNSSQDFKFLSDGFQVNSTFNAFNATGYTYAYMAFADPNV